VSLGLFCSSIPPAWGSYPTVSYVHHQLDGADTRASCCLSLSLSLSVPSWTGLVLYSTESTPRSREGNLINCSGI
ncbi:hypothetical protein HOY82DRAFT_550792, partial [Tuber indicum]